MSVLQGIAMKVLLTLALCVACIAPIAAHDRKAVGALTLVLGWEKEPAFSGSINGVVVGITDKTGPLIKVEGGLSVEITFGTERITLPLEPAFNRPHEFHAALVPTRAGTYTFHVTGRINNQPIDVTSTCGEGTFDCIADASAIQFPVKDPSAGELSARLERSLPRVDDAARDASTTRRIALAALGLSVASLVAAMSLRSRKRT